jgi:FkbM family methyltransferase
VNLPAFIISAARSTMSSTGAKWLKFDVTKRVQTFLLDRMSELRGSDVSFIQVGANDGVTSDPLYAHVHKHKWSGLVIEAVDEFFKQLTENYAPIETVQCVKALCAEVRTPLTFFKVKNIDRLPSPELRGISSLSRDVIRGHFDSDATFREFVEEISLEAVPLDEVMRAHGVARTNILLIDTEGADLRVLRGFDLDRFQPDLVMMEYYHLSLGERQMLNTRMHAAGYQRVIGAMDVFFIKSELIDEDELNILNSFRQPSWAWSWQDNHKEAASPPSDAERAADTAESALKQMLADRDHRIGQLEVQLADSNIRSQSVARELVDLHHRLSHAYHALNNLDEALQAARHAFALGPQDATIACHLGALLVLGDRLDEAALVLDKALVLDPQSAPVHLHISTLRARKGEWPQAIASAERALALAAPQQTEFRTHLENLLALSRERAPEPAVQSDR